MTDINGKRALVTGAAGGIGRLLAEKLARAGARLVLWDIDTEALTRLQSELIAAGYAVDVYSCDLASREEIGAVAAKTLAQSGPVDILGPYRDDCIGRGPSRHGPAGGLLFQQVRCRGLRRGPATGTATGEQQRRYDRRVSVFRGHRHVRRRQHALFVAVADTQARARGGSDHCSHTQGPAQARHAVVRVHGMAFSPVARPLVRCPDGVLRRKPQHARFPPGAALGTDFFDICRKWRGTLRGSAIKLPERKEQKRENRFGEAIDDWGAGRRIGRLRGNRD